MGKAASWFKGAMLGGLVGSVLVLLYTPYSGSELKARARDYVDNIKLEMEAAGEEKREELESQLRQLRSGEM